MKIKIIIICGMTQKQLHRGKLIALDAYIRKEELFKMNNVSFYFIGK